MRVICARKSHILLACLLCTLLVVGTGCFPGNKVSNDNSIFSGEVWSFESHRQEIAPEHWKDEKVRYEDKPTLALAGGGKPFVYGKWVRIVETTPNTYYRFATPFIAKNVEELRRTVLARILWQNANGEQIGVAEYPVTLRKKNELGWNVIAQTYKSPDKAKQAKLELAYRWGSDGMVYFGNTSFEEVEEPQPRIVRLATVHYRPQESTTEKNLGKFAELVGQAAMKNADIVCLPEGITMVGTGQKYVDVSEPVPGPTTKFLGATAKRYGLYIVAGICEREGPVVYNTNILIGRNGELVGKYRKVCLPREEAEGGVTVGEEFGVFDTDFGRIGMMICWDVFFPEPARMLALKGAEVIFMPIWGGNLTLTRARAIENQVYLITSSYDMKSAVFDREGEIVLEATDEEPVIVVDVDLNKQKLWPWLGDYKNRFPREMPPKRILLFEDDIDK